MATDQTVRIHFMGIGGIGMSGLARICRDRGAWVSGCDAACNGMANPLQRLGIPVAVGHHPGHLEEPMDLLVYSAAVSGDEPELLAARARGIRTIRRGELLAELSKDYRLVAVAGAHGKTTTAGMASQLLIRAGWDPTVVVGGLMVSMGTNARCGTGSYLVAEADESDGSFLSLAPSVAIVTNIDREHLNHYGTFDRLTEAFEQFTGQLEPGGTLISCQDDPTVQCRLRHPSMLSYGILTEADVTAQRITLEGHASRFRAAFRGRDLGTFALQVPGRHNILNALAVIGLGLVLDIPLVSVREALAEFAGTKRRFQLRRLPGDIWLVEDYAHHPAEIEATLSADATWGRRRLVVFQPHRFSRTYSLEREYTQCFGRADGLIVTDIYSAFESPIPGVSGRRLAGLIHDGGHPHVRYVPRRQLSSFVSRVARAGDTIFFLGAGDIGQSVHDVVTQLDTSERAAG